MNATSHYYLLMNDTKVIFVHECAPETFCTWVRPRQSFLFVNSTVANFCMRSAALMFLTDVSVGCGRFVTDTSKLVSCFVYLRGLMFTSLMRNNYTPKWKKNSFKDSDSEQWRFKNSLSPPAYLKSGPCSCRFHVIICKCNIRNKISFKILLTCNYDGYILKYECR
jgi:hypothetical protein